ncbi:MAG: DUF192 domain-containing protein [Pseudomonadota bacterium]
MLRAILLLCVLLLAPACQAGPATVSLDINGHAVTAELAITQAEQERGLMYRKALPTDHGMLFVFEVPDRYSMWMENTTLPLAVAFIGRDGVILNIEEMQPLTRDHHTAAGDVWYALEMNAGWFAKNGIKPGDKVHGLEQAARRR